MKQALAPLLLAAAWLAPTPATALCVLCSCTVATDPLNFGNFDPFGDFDLIFGAAKQNLKIIETPIHYKARTFGETQISRFRDGWLLLKMVWFAYRKLKAI